MRPLTLDEGDIGLLEALIKSAHAAITKAIYEHDSDAAFQARGLCIDMSGEMRRILGREVSLVEIGDERAKPLARWMHLGTLLHYAAWRLETNGHNGDNGQDGEYKNYGALRAMMQKYLNNDTITYRDVIQAFYNPKTPPSFKLLLRLMEDIKREYPTPHPQ
ncbi:hypothetical protein HYS31_05255 [Candidatus Woesearchaeota archaeon]|nr:hypothetical protein [Candidatus Woesearchaeota archaeon]